MIGITLPQRTSEEDRRAERDHVEVVEILLPAQPCLGVEELRLKRVFVVLEPYRHGGSIDILLEDDAPPRKGRVRQVDGCVRGTGACIADAVSHTVEGAAQLSGTACETAVLVEALSAIAIDVACAKSGEPFLGKASLHIPRVSVRFAGEISFLVVVGEEREETGKLVLQEKTRLPKLGWSVSSRVVRPCVRSAEADQEAGDLRIPHSFDIPEVILAPGG